MAEQYLVSARKYRPQTFDTVVGQSHITTTLQNAIRNQHLAHAYLFCGPRGVGKTTCARILAKTINCEHPTPEMEACGECVNCKTFNENASFNVFELDAASNNSVDDIRSLTEQVRFAPQMGKYKVYIIDEVHMLSSNAFNAFLKTLEEPPPYAIFILATTEKHKILPTILSRCQIFDFKRIQTVDIVQHLASICQKEGVAAEEAGLHIIAQKSEGCMRDALSMMDRISSFSNGNLTYEQAVEHLNILDAGFYFKLLDALLTTNVAETMILLDEVYKRGFEGDAILNGFAQHLRDLLLCKDAKMTKLLDIPETHKRTFFEKAQILPYSYISSALNIISDAEVSYRTTLNKRLHLEVSFLKLCYLPHVFQTSSLQGEKKNEGRVEQATTKIVSLSNENVEKRQENSKIEGSTGVETAVEIINTAETDAKFSSLVREEEVPLNKPAAPPTLPRFGKDFLKQMQHIASEDANDVQVVEIDNKLATSLLEEYILRLRNESDKQLQATNLSNVKIEVREDGTLALLCFSNIGLIYANGNAEAFREFCKEKTNNQHLKVSAELDPNALKEEDAPKQLSRSELFKVYAEKNPFLMGLKMDLRLEVKAF